MTTGPPKLLDGANVVMYTPIDERHRATRTCRQFVDGELLGPSTGLAICQYTGEQSLYLFSCDEQWNVLTDTLHNTLAEAQAQAEFEYEGVSETWQTK